MTADIVRAIFEYQIAEDRRLWAEAIMPLSEESFRHDTGYSWGSLQRECVHVVNVMQHSLDRVRGIKVMTAALTIEDPPREQVRAAWDRVEAHWTRYIDQLDDEIVQRDVDIVYRERAMTTPVWQTIFHFFNHNTLHRAEMRQMVALLGGAANPDRGFIVYCLARSKDTGQGS
ncbi:MAG: DinB family protein [Chloroflexi bacterium]|nr:DinB family protein [Chloroflexota bacterium]